MKTEEKIIEEIDPEEFVPTFVGASADLAAHQWSQNYLALQILKSVESFSKRLVGRITKSRDALQIIQVAIDDYEIVPEYDSPLGEKDQLYDFLLEIPGIKHKIANRVIRKYPNYSSLLRASVSDLMEIPRIGKALAERIKEKVNRFFS